MWLLEAEFFLWQSVQVGAKTPGRAVPTGPSPETQPPMCYVDQLQPGGKYLKYKKDKYVHVQVLHKAYLKILNRHISNLSDLNVPLAMKHTVAFRDSQETPGGKNTFKQDPGVRSTPILHTLSLPEKNCSSENRCGEVYVYVCNRIKIAYVEETNAASHNMHASLY